MSFADSLHALFRDSNAIWGFLTAAGIVLALTPLVARVAPRIGGVDDKADRPRVHGVREGHLSGYTNGDRAASEPTAGLQELVPPVDTWSEKRGC